MHYTTDISDGIPVCAEPASTSGSSQVPTVPSTSADLMRLQDALRARNVLVAHYGRYWLLSGPDDSLAIVLDPTSPTLEFHSLDGLKILSGHLKVLCESERVQLLADVVGAV